MWTSTSCSNQELLVERTQLLTSWPWQIRLAPKWRIYVWRSIHSTAVGLSLLLHCVHQRQAREFSSQIRRSYRTRSEGEQFIQVTKNHLPRGYGRLQRYCFTIAIGLHQLNLESTFNQCAYQIKETLQELAAMFSLDGKNQTSRRLHPSFNNLL